jgi:hypothetical protein
MFEDEKDDAISQLFLRSERNLEKDLPSEGLWARIEKKLDHDSATHLKVEKTVATGSIARWNPRYWLAAASVAACILSAVAVWRMFDMSPQENVLADMTVRPTSSQSAPIAADNNISAELPINNVEKEATYKSEDSAAKISNGVSYNAKSLESTKKASPIVLTPIADLPTTITITQSAAKMETPVVPNTEFAYEARKSSAPSVKDDANMGISADDIKIPMVNNANIQSNRYISPPAPQADKEKIVLSERNVSDNILEERDYAENNTVAAKGALRSRNESKNKASDAKADRKSPSIATMPSDVIFDKINPRLSIFIWLVGKWSETRHDGVSFEEWQIKNRNTLIGKGYKVKDGDKLFEEHMTIFFDEKNQQTYLSLNVDDFKDPIVYTLSRSVGDELVFTRDIQGQYPEKIIIQRTLDGYAIILANEKAELTTTQQRFLNQRNAVSNYRATRHLRRSTTRTVNEK